MQTHQDQRAKITCEQKALEILRAMAQRAAAGKSLTITEDWGFGSATVIDQDGAHTHVGSDTVDESANFEAFVDQMHSLLVDFKGFKHGLSWVEPAKSQVPQPNEILNGRISTPRADDHVTAKIENHLRQLPPHVAEREAAKLLREAMNEIMRLERGEFICRRCGLRKDGECGAPAF